MDAAEVSVLQSGPALRPAVPGTAAGQDGRCVVFAWPDFEPQNLFAGLTASRLALVNALARSGTRVTMVWTGPRGADGETRLQEWVAGRQIPCVSVETAPTACKMKFPWRLGWERAFDFHMWLRHYSAEHSVAAVNMPDLGGVGYYALLAKRGDLEYQDIRFVIEASGPLRRLKSLDHLAIDNLADLYQDFTERRAIEMADDLVVPHACVVDWLSAHDWAMPSRVVAIEPSIEVTAPIKRAGRPARIVFMAPLRMSGEFPRLCRALGQESVRSHLQDIEVIFWGPVEHRKAIKYLTSCSAAWSFRWRVEDDLSESALCGLFGDGAAAAIFPDGKSAAWLPYQWCRAAGVPCTEFALAFPQSGRKHIDASDATRLQDVPDPDALHRAIETVLIGESDAGAVPVPDRERLERRCDLTRAPTTIQDLTRDTPQTPLVSVCIVTRNRARLLPQALASIEAQDYPEVEVVLVDDGSTMRDALDLLDELEPRFRDKGWKLLRQHERTFHAAARNRAVREARGTWVLLFDDDCVSETHQIRTVVHYALHMGAAIVTSPRHVFTGDHAPAGGDRSGFVWVPLGAMPTAGLFENCLGDTNMLIRRDVFLKFDGLRTDFGVPSADREFLIRATAAGARLEVVPEVLYHYRMTAGSVSRGLMPDTTALRDLRFARPFVELLPRTLGDLPHIAAGWMRRCRKLESDLLKAATRIEHLEERLKNRPGIQREFHIRLTPTSIRRWLVKLWRSIAKRLFGRRNSRRSRP